jgi:purine-binding chemotaxis protein CheW
MLTSRENTLHLSPPTQSGHWLIFRLEGQDYALALSPIAEVLRMVASTPVPEAPAALMGMINVRGRVVPIIDLRARLGLPSSPPSLSARIILVYLDQRLIGLVVDEVVEVLVFPAEALGQPDALLGTAVPVLFTLEWQGRLILGLDLPRLCTGLEALTPLADP